MSTISLHPPIYSLTKPYYAMYRCRHGWLAINLHGMCTTARYHEDSGEIVTAKLRLWLS